MTIIILSIILGLVAFSGLISAAETAITASSPGKMQKLRVEGNKKAISVLKVLRIKEKVISTLLIGNSIANILCTTLATSMFIEIFGDSTGTIISSIVMSFVIIVFAEVVPKAIAVGKPEKIALASVSTLKFFLKILEPVNIMLGAVVKAICFIFRINLNSEISGTEEVRGVIEHHMHEGNVYKDDRDMLGGVLDIRNMAISDIMVHRSNIVAINIDTPIDKIVKAALSSTHSRIPFWKGNKDNIIGIMHIRNLLNKLHDNNSNLEEININDFLTPPVFVPDNALVIKQLQNFREGQSHLACVVDEYGDLQGIITLEDILEEIVGQIYDEHDLDSDKIKKNSDTEYIIDGSVSVRDLNRELNWQLPETDATTLAGFIINKMERIPNHGEFLIVKNLKLLVIKKSLNRIKSIKVVILQQEETTSDRH